MPPSAPARAGALLVLLPFLLSAACASATSVARPSPFPGAPAEVRGETLPVASPEAAEAVEVVQTALGLQGTPYEFGGDEPDTGFDCSGLVQYVFARIGIQVPRTAAAQYAIGRAVPLADVRPGDLIFFSTIAPGASHVGIALGGAEFVHAPSSDGVVRIERFDSEYWRTRLVGIRRLLY